MKVQHTRLTFAGADSKQGCKLGSDSCGRYSLIAADLRDTSSLKQTLSNAGVDFSAPTIFLAECVLVYMEPQESLALLEVLSLLVYLRTYILRDFNT